MTMTEKDKAKAYDEAIRRAKKKMDEGYFVLMPEIFPELCESEDERIRKAIIEHYRGMHSATFPLRGLSREEYIAWLEKQGHDGKKWIYEDTYNKEKEQVYQDGIDDVLENPQKYGLEKQGEQKPAEWNEEDSKRLQRIIDFLWHNRKGDTDTIYQQEQDIDWLKSLRLQNHWKPSDEQMEALANALSLAKNCGEESSFDLRKLYEQLKKLTE